MKKQTSILIIVIILGGIFSISAAGQTRVTGEQDQSDYRVREDAVSADRVRAEATNSYAISSGDGYVFFNQSGNTSSQLSLSKTFEADSKKNEGTFNVDESIKNINVMVNGSVKTGKIIITLMLPDGKALKEITIDESADIQFNQNIRIAKDETKYFGKWTYIVEPVKATGKYRLSLNTN
jgi:hypothetical protein